MASGEPATETAKQSAPQDRTEIDFLSIIAPSIRGGHEIMLQFPILSRGCQHFRSPAYRMGSRGGSQLTCLPQLQGFAFCA